MVTFDWTLGARQEYLRDVSPPRRWRNTSPTVDGPIAITRPLPQPRCPRCDAPVDGHGHFSGEGMDPSGRYSRNTPAIYAPTNAVGDGLERRDVILRQAKARQKDRRCSSCKRPGAQCNCRGQW